MAAVNDILIRTPIAAVNKDSSLRVYEVGVDGGIRETQYEGKWTGGTSKNIIAQGKVNTPVAATSLALNNIRVYYIDGQQKLREACYDSGKPWYDGGLSGSNFIVAPYSSVAAVFLGNKTVLRVYAQLPNNTIQEYTWDNNGKWNTGSNLGAALPGTSIAATTWGNTPNIRVYLQDPNLNIIEKAWDGQGWYTGYSFKTPVVRASLSAINWTNNNGVYLRVYYSASGDTLKEKAYDVNKWYDGGFTQQSLPASNVASITLNPNNPDLRIYLQNGTQATAVSEFVWSGSWKPGNPALPPA